MSYTFLQEQGEESLAECFSDIEQSVRLKLNLTAEKFSCNDNETESCRGSQFGTMCEHLMENRGEGLQTLCVEGSPVKILAKLEQQTEQKDLMESVLVYGQSLQGSFMKYDQRTSSWKTHQCSLFGGLTEFSDSWPRWGMMQNGECSVLGTLAHCTSVKGYGSWPTPIKSDYFPICKKTMEWKEQGKDRPSGAKIGFSLKWHRPCVERWTENGKIIPMLHETLMMWPIGWTALRPLAMDKYRQWLLAHGVR
jgi:hypothetical protein